MRKIMTLPALLKKTQIKFNAFIRQRDAENGCISCLNKVEHAGHFFSVGSYSSLRFDFDNVHGQCAGCNTYRHGNLIEYQIGLTKRYGEQFTKNLIQKSRTNKVKKWTRDELHLIIRLCENQK